MTLKKWLAVAATGAVLGGGWYLSRGEYVTEVIDGDSFKIANKQTIRLASLDAPELEYCMGRQAKDALTKKILNKRVLLKDVKTDIYRRIIALVYVDGKLVNEYMIKNGLAVSSRQAGDENPAVRAANDYARSNKIGIFSPACWGLTPPNPKCTIKGNIDDRNKQKEYLTPDCPDYSKTIIERSYGEDWYCSIAEARKAGYERSSSCTR